MKIQFILKWQLMTSSSDWACLCLHCGGTATTGWRER